MICKQRFGNQKARTKLVTMQLLSKTEKAKKKTDFGR
jgi:hypothetical protein